MTLSSDDDDDAKIYDDENENRKSRFTSLTN